MYKMYCTLKFNSLLNNDWSQTLGLGSMKNDMLQLNLTIKSSKVYAFQHYILVISLQQ